MQVAADHGRINFFGGLPKDGDPVRIDSNRVHYGELVVTGSHGCCTEHCRRALELQGERVVDLKPLITNLFDLSQANEAMAAALSGTGLKTVIRPWPAETPG